MQAVARAVVPRGLLAQPDQGIHDFEQFRGGGMKRAVLDFGRIEFVGQVVADRAAAKRDGHYPTTSFALFTRSRIFSSTWALDLVLGILPKRLEQEVFELHTRGVYTKTRFYELNLWEGKQGSYRRLRFMVECQK